MRARVIATAYAAAGVLLVSCSTAKSAALVADVSTQPPVVKTAAGDVAGLREGALVVFRGVPFAAPPIGDNRWRPPLPATQWEGVKDATKDAPACHQASKPAAGGVSADQSSEDCL